MLKESIGFPIAVVADLGNLALAQLKIFPLAAALGGLGKISWSGLVLGESLEYHS